MLGHNASKKQANQWIEQKPWKCGSAPLLGVVTPLCSPLFRIPGTVYSFIVSFLFAPRHPSFISGAENLQREDLSAIETIEAVVEIVDAELMEDKEYASMGKKPGDRVKALLGKLHSITISKNRGSKISKKAELLFNKFVKQVDKIFKNLPKSLEWQSFYIHDLPLLMDISKEVQEVSIQHRPWPRPGL